LSNSQARPKRSLIDIIKDQGIKERKLAGDNRINFSGVSASSSPLGGASGKATLQNINSQDAFLKTAGDTMIGPIAYFPVAVTIATGAIDISRATTINFSSYVIISGEGAADDILATITGAEHAGQILYLQPILTNQITLTETGGNLILPGGSDVVANSAKDGRTILKFIFDVTVNANKWTLVSNSDTVTVGNEFADNLFRIFDDIDGTRKLAFQVGGIAAGTTRTLTVQNASGTIPLLDGSAGAQVFSNVIQMNAIFDLDGNDLVLDVDADSKFVTSVDDVLTLNLLGSAQFIWNTTRFDISAKDMQLSEIANPGAPGATAGRIFLDSVDNTLKVRKSSGTVSLEGGGPPFNDNQDIIQDDVDNTKKLRFSLASFATATTSIIGSNTLTAGRTWSFPNATGVVPLISLAQTWTAVQTHNNDILGANLANLGSGTSEFISIFLTGNVFLGGTTTQKISADAGGINLDVPTGDSFDLRINAISQYLFNASQLDVQGNDIIDIGTLGFDISTQTIVSSASGFQFNLPTADTYTFRINSVSGHIKS